MATPHITLKRKKSLEQVQLCLGMPAPPVNDSRRYVVYLLNTMLGGGMSSRLFQTIREDQGLAYSIYSEMNPFRDTGSLCVYAGTSVDKTQEVLQLTLQELRRLKEETVSEVELKRAKDQLKSNMVIGLESSGSRMANLARQQMYFGRFFGVDEIMQEIEAVIDGRCADAGAGAFPAGDDGVDAAGKSWHDEDRAGRFSLLGRLLIEFCSVVENEDCRGLKKTMNARDRLRAGLQVRRNEDGFTLIELLIVMSVMLILMTLAVPQLLKLRKQAQETSAVQSLRTIGQAELQYNSAYPANGFSCSLATLGGDPKSGAPTAQAAQLITPDLARGQKAGYTFAITNCTKVTVNNQDMYTSL